MQIALRPKHVPTFENSETWRAHTSRALWPLVIGCGGDYLF